MVVLVNIQILKSTFLNVNTTYIDNKRYQQNKFTFLTK